MRVLLAARYTVRQVQMGGVQSWIESVTAPMRAQGHEVVTWGRGEATPSERFELGILAHWCETGHLAAICDRTVCVSHGPIEPERPGPADRVVFTSEGVRDHWNGEGDIVRQPIDLEFWSPAPARRVYLTRHSYRNGLVFVPRLASDLNLKFKHVSRASYRQVREALRESAVVLATGRAALEAMACDVPVVICDHRHQYQDALLDPDTRGAMTRNYSGRGGVTPTIENVRAAACEAMKVGGLRAHVRQHHDAAQIAAQLLA